MAKQNQIAAKRLVDSKVTDFIGIQENVEPLSDRKSVIKCTNLEPHVKPGKFTLREPYQLKYKHPTDPLYDRNNGEEYISFDNFYEKTAKDQAEVTVLISKAEINAPLVSGTRITSYKFNSVNIYIRPYWTGSYWKNSWLWLNEPIITKVTVAPDGTYKNKIQVQGYFGNLLQWTLINVTKDKTLPYAVIRSAQNGNNTDLWLSVFDPNIAANDEIVLMRNYIPIKYLLQNYNVTREEISFHRILSRMRIGFGGKEGRIALGVDYVHSTLRLASYEFTTTDPILDKIYFANVNRMVVQPYTLFNDNNDFLMDFYIDTGTLVAKTYYFRMTAVMNNTDEILVLEKSIAVELNKSVIAIPSIRAGSLSRRLTAVKIYFSDDKLSYYLWKEFPVVNTGDVVINNDWALLDNGYFQYLSTANAISIPGELLTEDCAASSSDSNKVGSFVGNTVSVVAATSFAIKSVLDFGTYSLAPALYYPLNKLDKMIESGKIYTFVFEHKADEIGTQSKEVSIYLFKPKIGTNDEVLFNLLESVPVHQTYSSETIEIEIPDMKEPLDNYYIVFYAHSLSPFNTIAYYLESLSIIEKNTVAINDIASLGSEMSEELGYEPTFNLVKDWQSAVYLNGRTYVSPAFIEKRYDTYVFGSMISGLGANMHDVIPAAGLVFPVDEFRGEVVIGMIVMHNLNIAILTDGGLIILDPDTGNTREVARGYGCRVKTSIVVFRGSIIYGSDGDFIEISAATGYEAKPMSERSVRDIYNNLPDKLKVHACFDKFGTYHVALGIDAEYRELIMTNRGWIDQDRLHYPEVFRNGLGGRVWFLNEGDIYAMPYSEAEFIGYADLYGDYRAGW